MRTICPEAGNLVLAKMLEKQKFDRVLMNPPRTSCSLPASLFTDVCIYPIEDRPYGEFLIYGIAFASQNEDGTSGNDVESITAVP
jgi:hypothetical protein